MGESNRSVRDELLVTLGTSLLGVISSEANRLAQVHPSKSITAEILICALYRKLRFRWRIVRFLKDVAPVKTMSQVLDGELRQKPRAGERRRQTGILLVALDPGLVNVLLESGRLAKRQGKKAGIKELFASIVSNQAVMTQLANQGIELKEVL